MTLIGLIGVAAPNSETVRGEGGGEPTLKVLLRGPTCHIGASTQIAAGEQDNFMVDHLISPCCV
jgi:hypothetical protein